MALESKELRCLVNDHFSLRELDLQLTNRCFHKCRHCCCDSGKDGDSGTSLENIRHLINQAKQLGVREIHVTGGEPMIRADCLDVLEIIHNAGLESQLQSTGYALKDHSNRERLSEFTNNVFMLSLDGLEDNHNYYRGKGDYHRVLQTAELVRSLGHTLRINTVVTQRNQHELEEILKLGKQLGAHVVSFFYFSPIGRGKAIDEEWIPPSEYIRIGRRLASFVREHRNTLPETIYFQFGYQNTDDNNNNLSIRCRAFDRDFLVVLSDGRVLPCTWYIDTDWSLGWAFEEPLTDIWDRYQHFVENIHKIPSGCTSCLHAEICRGGCSAARFIAHDEKDPRCQISGSFIPGCPERKMAL